MIGPIQASDLLAGLGALAAGIGLYRFGTSRGMVQAQIVKAVELFCATQDRIADAQERQAKALEENARLIPLLESLAAQREQVGLTMRVISRELRELKELMAPHDEPAG